MCMSRDAYIPVKTDVYDLTIEEASKILQLRPVSYEMKGGSPFGDTVRKVKYGSDTEFGFIDDEVKDIDEAFVELDEDGNVDHVLMMSMISCLVKMVKEINEKSGAVLIKATSEEDAIAKSAIDTGNLYYWE